MRPSVQHSMHYKPAVFAGSLRPFSGVYLSVSDTAFSCVFACWSCIEGLQTVMWVLCDRYRSQLCNDGPKCKRKVCFFAHTIDELRVPPSKPFVAPDMLVGSPETEGPESQVTPYVSTMEYEAHWHIPWPLTTHIQSLPALQA